MIRLYLATTLFSVLTWVLFTRFYSQLTLNPRTFPLFLMPIINIVVAVVLFPMAILRIMFLLKLINFDVKEIAKTYTKEP